jgi:hypothetical protein
MTHSHVYIYDSFEGHNYRCCALGEMDQLYFVLDHPRRPFLEALGHSSYRFQMRSYRLRSSHGILARGSLGGRDRAAHSLRGYTLHSPRLRYGTHTRTTYIHPLLGRTTRSGLVATVAGTDYLVRSSLPGTHSS